MVVELFCAEAILLGGVGVYVVLGAGGRLGVRLTREAGGLGFAQLNMLEPQLPPVLWQPVETTTARLQAVMRICVNRDMLLRIT